MIPGILMSLLSSRMGITIIGFALMALAIPAAYGVGYFKGKWQAEVSMISAIEKANLEAQIANLKKEKQVAEDAAKTAETDRADLEALIAQQEGTINEWKLKVEQSGKKCPIDPADMCRLYGVCDGNKSKSRKQTGGNKSSRLAINISTGERTHSPARLSIGQ